MAFDKLAWQRERRRKTANSDVHKYEKTPKGFLMRVYRNMQSRVTGVQKREAHIYVGLPILARETFYEWALNDPTFRSLFADWEANKYKRRLTPSIDRMDGKHGYELWNIRWVTQSRNSGMTKRCNCGG